MPEIRCVDAAAEVSAHRHVGVQSDAGGIQQVSTSVRVC
jgi:hypothetical protein